MKTVSAIVAVIALSAMATDVAAKAPGATYCYNGVCHRVRTLEETQAAVGRPERVMASFYDRPATAKPTSGKLTSSGAPSDPDNVAAVASPVWPDGTVVVIRHPQNGQTAVVRVTDSGPYFGNRTLDVSRSLADALGVRTSGVAELELVVLVAPTQDEAIFKKGRTYPAVAGPIGAFSSLSDAMAPSMSHPGGSIAAPRAATLPPPRPAVQAAAPPRAQKPAPKVAASLPPAKKPVAAPAARALKPTQVRSDVLETEQFVAEALNRNTSAR